MASAFTFANVNMKTADGYFLGFPAIWNLVVFYLVILGLGPWVSFVIIGLCLILTFMAGPAGLVVYLLLRTVVTRLRGSVAEAAPA